MDKTCSYCKIKKDVSFFRIRKERKNLQYTPRCVPCMNLLVRKDRKKNPDKYFEAQQKYRASNKKNGKRYYGEYGINLNDYNEMLLNQKNKCKICKIHSSKLSRRLSVDHCHVSGKPRALLCDKCNHVLGHSNDNIKILNEAIKYLKKFESHEVQKSWQI